MTVNLPASGDLATPLSAAGFFAVQVKILIFIGSSNGLTKQEIPKLRQFFAVNCKLSEVSDNLKSTKWRLLFSLFVPFCFHVYFLTHFCINFPLYFFVPIFESSFLCQFSLALFCIIFYPRLFVSFFDSSFLYQLFWLIIFVPVRILAFCIIFLFHFQNATKYFNQKACS